MAQRRMFSPEIVCSDEFLGMPPSTRELYFQLGMRADDDGFIQPRSVIKLIDAKEDDLRMLVARRFVLPFESGVVVIKHWLIHNMIRLDRYKPTRFQEEKKRLQIKENKAYTDNLHPGLQSGNHLAPQVRLGKDREGYKYEIVSENPKKDKTNLEGFESWWNGYPRKSNKTGASAEWRKMGEADRVLAINRNSEMKGKWPDTQYVPMPNKYLAERRWEDELPGDKKSNVYVV